MSQTLYTNLQFHGNIFHHSVIKYHLFTGNHFTHFLFNIYIITESKTENFLVYLQLFFNLIFVDNIIVL